MLPVSTKALRTRHRLQFAGAILATVGAVFGFSRLIKPRVVPKPIPIAKYVPPPPPPILRVDPPILRPATPPPPLVSPAFMSAVAEGDLAILEKLYTKNMPLNGTLHTAAVAGDKATVEWLLNHDADVHEGEAEAEAPILVADAHPEIAKLLLDRGVNEPDLAVAAMAGAPNAVTRLLSKKAAVNPKDGSTPLADAVSSTLATPANKRIIVDKLLAAGADPNIGDTTPLAGAISTCETGDEESANEKSPMCLALIRALTTHGAKVSSDALVASLNLSEPLRTRVLDPLLAGRLEPDATAVALGQWASTDNDPAPLKKLIAKGVAWSWHDGEDDAAAPLLDAIDRLDVARVKLMVEAGAPSDMHFKDGRSPLGLALEKVVEGNTDSARIIEALLTHGANVNRRLPDGRTPLFAAAETGDIRIINAMLDRGARVNEAILDETALDAAERSGHIPAARVLHARGGRRATRPADTEKP